MMAIPTCRLSYQFYQMDMNELVFELYLFVSSRFSEETQAKSFR